jgi:PAS domain S-box-containing protein
MATTALLSSRRLGLLLPRARRLARRSRLRVVSAAGAIALVALVLLAVGMVRALVEQNQAAGAIAHTLRALEGVSAINANLDGAVRAGRDFLTSHDPESRRRFEAAGQAADRMITVLSRRLAGQPEQQDLADQLRSLIAARVVLLRDAIARSMDPNADDPVLQATQMERAREVAEAITATTDQLTAGQRQLLAAQNVAMQRAWRGTLFGLSLCGICLAICVALVVLLRADGLRHLRRIHRSNAQLQRSIQQRTDAFTASEAKLRTYLMHLADGLSVIRVEPDGRFVTEEINAAARAILDLGDLEVIGTAPEDLYRGEERSAIVDRMRECVQSELPIRYNKTIFTRRGRRELRVSLAPVRGSASEAYPQGRIELILHSMRDVTGEAEREERLRQSQRVEAVGRLTAGVAHDFNNLLQALMGGLELALADVTDRPDAAESIHTALQAARRGAQLTSQLLSFSRQQILRPVAVDIGQQLRDLAGALNRTLGHDIEVEVVVAPGLPPAYADPAHLSSALLNLALNARDAMPRGGSLRIEAFAAGKELVVAVSDTGEGMPPEVVARACEPFFTTRGVSGTGLGLSMVHGFARQSGGDLRIRSRVGEGTRVEIVLLPAPAGTAMEPPASAETPTSCFGRILIVDDEADVRQVTSAFLRKAGFEVTEARDADVALKVLADGRRFDALVTDYAMAGMNGVELVMRAREIEPGQPALIITGYAGAEGLRWLPPDVVVLRKPFKRADFVRAVKNLVEAADPVAPDHATGDPVGAFVSAEGSLLG